MSTFHVTLVINTDTADHAHQVVAERVGYDEQLEDEDGVEFDYTIDVLYDMREVS